MKKIALAIVASGLALSLSGCGSNSKTFESWKDAPVSGRNEKPASLITFPDGYGNVATKCDNGNRVYSSFVGSDGSAGRALAVVPNDPSCS